jgi:hypothetical protein
MRLQACLPSLLADEQLSGEALAIASILVAVYRQSGLMDDLCDTAQLIAAAPVSTSHATIVSASTLKAQLITLLSSDTLSNEQSTRLRHSLTAPIFVTMVDDDLVKLTVEHMGPESPS